jgi:hypothetical protein
MKSFLRFLREYSFHNHDSATAVLDAPSVDTPEVVPVKRNPLGIGLVLRSGEVRWAQRDYADSMWGMYHSDEFGTLADRTPSSGHFRAYEDTLIFDETPSQEEYFKALDAAEKRGFTIRYVKTSLAGSRRDRANFNPRGLEEASLDTQLSRLKLTGALIDIPQDDKWGRDWALGIVRPNEVLLKVFDHRGAFNRTMHSDVWPNQSRLAAGSTRFRFSEGELYFDDTPDADDVMRATDALARQGLTVEE